MSARREADPVEVSRRGCGAYLPTNEDWAPTLPGGVLRVRIFPLLNDSGWRILVTGGDDFGMERDVADRDHAEALLRRIPTPITVAALRAQGYVNF